MKVLLLTLAVAVAVLAQTPPVWPVRFQQDFVESWTTTPYHDVGKLWYDSERGMSRLDRSNGKFDPFCSSVSNATTPCTQLVRDSKRYLIYPLLRICCYCCDSAHGCGILKREWLSNSKFVGKEELSGQFFNKFTDTDAQTDYWSAIDEKQTPRKLVEGSQIFKDFIMNTYSEEYISDATFALPSYCGTNVCPETSRCARFRN
jgi:hypothetical protein